MILFLSVKLLTCRFDGKHRELLRKNTLKVVIIHTFPDCSQLTFGKGSSADWTIFLKRPNQRCKESTMADCILEMNNLGERYGGECLYNSFLQVYKLASAEIDDEVFNAIYSIAQEYSADLMDVMLLFSEFYAHMVALENNADAKGGKHRCLLAVYMLLMEDQDAKFVITFVRKAKKDDIDNICEIKGLSE